jgi:hypothetical protein
MLLMPLQREGNAKQHISNVDLLPYQLAAEYET